MTEEQRAVKEIVEVKQGKNQIFFIRGNLRVGPFPANPSEFQVEDYFKIAEQLDVPSHMVVAAHSRWLARDQSANEQAVRQSIEKGQEPSISDLVSPIVEEITRSLEEAQARTTTELRERDASMEAEIRKTVNGTGKKVRVYKVSIVALLMLLFVVVDLCLFPLCDMISVLAILTLEATVVLGFPTLLEWITR
jgi:hypothetical protein